MSKHPDPIGAARDEAAEAGIAKSRLPTPGEHAGDLIGRYKLLEQIGEGGMGTIWMAEQREPVRRRVALKIIKLGMDTKQVIARFEAERQALALMDHPHIAKVLDAGATDAGRPYFVMDYIKGIPILEYCDQERLDTKARLELFTSVCHAIQHAHHKGIVHRDIKPSNVLVTLHDGVPVPKVIDFGIAKATNSELTSKTLFTEHRQMIGTPAYMSPEQAEMSGLDIDTRSDIYSLGVLLYELLTGTTPFDMKTLLESGYDEMLRAIREVEPHKPSTRISTLGDTGARTAQQRRVEVKKLSLLLRGDLDWIVMKCLEKDRTRRYETANSLASDLLRHLHDEPVNAGPPSSTYKIRKFVRRHRLQVFAACIVLLALLAGTVGTSWGLVVQSEAKTARLEQELKDQKRSSEENARRSQNAEAVAGLLGQCEESLRAGDASKATIALDAARARSQEGGAEGDGARLARLAADLDLLNELDAIDQFKWTWVDGAFPKPIQAANRAHDALRRFGVEPGTTSVEEAAARVVASAIRGRIVLVMNWIFMNYSTDRANALLGVLKKVDADPFRDAFRDAVLADDTAKFQALAGTPAVLEQPPEFTAALGQSSLLAVERRREVMEMAAFRRPSDRTLSMALQSTYDGAAKDTADERIRWLQSVLAADPEYVAAYINLGIALLDAKRPDEAAACDRRALEIAPRDDHPQILCNLGVVLEAQGKFDEAIACDRQALEIDPDNATAHFNLGVLLGKQGKSVEALASLRRSIELKPDYAKVHSNVGDELRKLGRLEEAEASFRRAIELDPKLTRPTWCLAELLESTGRPEEAIPWRRKYAELEPSAYSYASLGDLLKKSGQRDEAIAAFRKSLELGPDNVSAMRALGETLMALGQKDEARSWFQKSVDRDPTNAVTWMNLGAMYHGKDPDASIACARKAIELDPSDHRFHHNLGIALGQAGRHDEAVAAQRKSVELAPEDAECHLDLAMALSNAGQRDAALARFRRVLELDPTRSKIRAHALYNIGVAMTGERRWDEAIACYRETIECDPDYAEAYCNLGQCHLAAGRFADALEWYRRGHELGSQRPDWRYPSAHWVRSTEAKVALEAQLPAILAGELEPVDNAQRLELAEMCFHKGLLHGEVQLMTDAFAADPRLADDVGNNHRYGTACSAARASAGLGNDAAELDDGERARLRRQAIEWLRADLDVLATKVASGPPAQRAAAKERLRRWQGDPELACLREVEALDLLPEEDRGELEDLWLDVADLVDR